MEVKFMGRQRRRGKGWTTTGQETLTLGTSKGASWSVV